MRIEAPRLLTLAALLGTALVGATLPAGLAAQTAPARLYQVEVVIFAHPPGTSVEHGPRGKPAMIDDGESAGPGTAAGERPGESAAADPADRPAPLAAGYAPPGAPLALGNVAARLNSGGYRLLWHQAWVQPAIDAPMDLAVLAALGRGRADPELTGAIGLSQGRFLHLGLDLEWRARGDLAAVLRERRRVRTGDDQYLDNPRIGAIAVVTEVRQGS